MTASPQKARGGLLPRHQRAALAWILCVLHEEGILAWEASTATRAEIERIEVTVPGLPSPLVWAWDGQRGAYKLDAGAQDWAAGRPVVRLLSTVDCWHLLIAVSYQTW